MRRSLGKRAQQISRQVFGRPIGSVGAPIVVTPRREDALTRAALPHYWYPERSGVEPCPKDFAARLAAVHPDLRLVRPPARAPVAIRCWFLWTKKESVRHELCPGWWLLMAWQVNGKPLPLDERLFAAIWHFDARNYKNAVEYFDRLIAERDRGRALEQKRYRTELQAQAKEFYDSLKISSAGRGNKFALHHDGTVVPSRGEIAWTKERSRLSLPSSVLREERERK